MKRRTVTRRRRPWALIASLAFAVATAAPASSGTSDGSETNGCSPSTVALVAKVLPTVVSIQTYRNLAPPHAETPNASASTNIERAEGAGFIVSADGFIATNRHVVDGAYAILVTLHDGKTTKAKVVWRSTVVDVAFLKIEADAPLPSAVLARDGSVRVGDRVVAIGSPMGLAGSVSVGVVSALNRNIKQSPYDNYIQTDAAINHGSSGGPLFDEAGEVVGMNSVLYSSVDNGGSEGLGFAIPGSDLSFLINQLRQTGHIACGWLGLMGQKLTPAMEDALAFPGSFGVIVASVDAKSAAAQAGLRRGDIIQTFDGHDLHDVTMLNRAACPALGRIVTMKVWREGRFMSLTARVAEAEDGSLGAGDEAKIATPRFASARDLGMTLLPVNDHTRQRYKLAADVNGFVVASVQDSGRADVSGLDPGDVILSLQMTPLSNHDSFDEIFARYGRSGHQYVIALVRKGGGDRWITLPVQLRSTP